MKIKKTILDTVLEPFSDLFAIDDAVEIVINRPTEIMIEHADGHWSEEVNPQITEEAMRDLITLCANISGQDFDNKRPRFSGRIPYGDTTLRVEAVSGSMIVSGFAMSIRVGKATLRPLSDWLSKEDEAKLIQCIKEHKTIMVNGATGSGKTTLLNSLIAHIPENERIITVEDTQELIVPHKNQVNLIKSKNDSDLGEIDYDDIINSITRLRPDRIIVGEIDTNNVMPFLRICNTGHEGSLTSIHAADPQEAFDAICLNAQLSGANSNRDTVMNYAKNAIHGFVSVTRRTENGKRVFSAKLIMTEDVNFDEYISR